MSLNTATAYCVISGDKGVEAQVGPVVPWIICNLIKILPFSAYYGIKPPRSSTQV